MAGAPAVGPAGRRRRPAAVVLLRGRREAGDLRLAGRRGRDLRGDPPPDRRPRVRFARRELPLLPRGDRDGQSRVRGHREQPGCRPLSGGGRRWATRFTRHSTARHDLAGYCRLETAPRADEGADAGARHAGLRGRADRAASSRGAGPDDRRPRATQRERRPADLRASQAQRHGERGGRQSAGRLARRRVAAVGAGVGGSSGRHGGAVSRGPFAAGRAAGARAARRRRGGLAAFGRDPPPAGHRRLRPDAPRLDRAARPGVRRPRPEPAGATGRDGIRLRSGGDVPRRRFHRVGPRPARARTRRRPTFA